MIEVFVIWAVAAVLLVLIPVAACLRAPGFRNRKRHRPAPAPQPAPVAVVANFSIEETVA